MKMKQLIATTAGLILLAIAATGVSRASVIAEVEANNSLAGAQNVDAYFSLDSNPYINDVFGNDISTTTPHVTINGGGDGSFDYYSFTVSAPNTVGVFDIDFGYYSQSLVFQGLDTEIAVWDSLGNLIDKNADRNANTWAEGSFTYHDSFLQITFANAGVYTIGVAEWPSVHVTGDGGWGVGANPLDAPNPLDLSNPFDNYTLNISIQNHPLNTVVPEPATMLMWGVGVCGLSLGAWRRRKLAA